MRNLETAAKSVAFIGFSANPEIVIETNRLDESEKAPLGEMKCELGGTSSNVALAMARMGLPTTLYTLSGCNGDFFTHSFRYAIKHADERINVVDFPVLEHGHMAFIPIDGLKRKSQVFGYKGKIQQEKVAEHLETIKKDSQENVWRIATGVRTSEVELVKALFGENHLGYRYLNPKMELIESKEIFFSLLKQTDILVVNDEEYAACVKNLGICSGSYMHTRFGISLVVITKDERGGEFSLVNKVVNVKQKFDAYTGFITEGSEIHQTSAGDWFAGALVGSLFETGKSSLEINEEEITNAIYFATKVSGKKVTMPGSSNGPNENDLKCMKEERLREVS